MKFNDPFSTSQTNGTTKSTPLIRVAEDILHYATVISDHFEDHSLAQPSFELDGPEDYPYELPDEIHDARAKLRGSTSAMASLAAGPKGSLMWMCWNYHDISTLSYVHHFRVAEAVPLEETISMSELAARTKTPLSQLKRVIRYLMLHHVFAEPRPGHIAHTPASRQLVTSEHVKAWIGVRTEETGPAAMSLVAATERWGGDAQELNQTPYSLAHSDGELSRFEYLARPGNKEREARFGKLMKAVQGTEGYSLQHTVDGFAWEQLGDGATVVDVGGNVGVTALAIARAHPNLRFIVQDLPGVVANGRKSLPVDMANCVQFMEYNFLEQVQPVPDAAAYVFRQIFHDWPDKYAAMILNHTASVMKPGQRMIIVDVVMPPPGSVLHQIESQLRRSDLEMMVQFNALEREASDWEELVKMADSRLELRSINKPLGSSNTIIEVMVGSEGVSQRATADEALTYGRRNSLIYADTQNMMNYGRRDSKTLGTAMVAP